MDVVKGLFLLLPNSHLSERIRKFLRLYNENGERNRRRLNKDRSVWSNIELTFSINHLCDEEGPTLLFHAANPSARFLGLSDGAL